MNPNSYVYSTDNSESNFLHEIYVSVNMCKVIDKHYE